MSDPNNGPASDVSLFPFTTRLGLVFIVESASLSAAAVTGLLLYILYSAVSLKSGASRHWTIATHVHVYFINLLVSDLVQAIGGLMDIKWIIDAQVSEGPLCTAQGIFKQMGDVGVALTSLTIAIHTFGVLVFRWKSPPKSAIMVVTLIWIFIALIVSIGFATHKHEDYYGDTQYWCWITSNFDGQRLGLEYFWLYLAAFANIIIYVFLALVVKGIILVNGRKITLQLPNKKSQLSLTSSRSDGQESNAIAMQMLFYPAVYIITVSPIAIVRWMSFSGKSVPFSATAVAGVLFSSSGLLNVILYKYTRPKLLPQRQGSSPNAHSFSYHTSHLTTLSSVRSPDSFGGHLSPEPEDFKLERPSYQHKATVFSRPSVPDVPSDVV